MTLLPILGRELRTRARSRASYWTRFGAGAVGALICLPQLLVPGPLGAPGGFGKGIFDAIVAGAFLVCCSACLLTADAISAERREGTLPLLFLTRLKAWDVLLGKFGSIGLTSLCVLAACLPMLTIPILAGGVTGGEACRKAAALFSMLLLALAIGLCASAAEQERSRAMRNAAGGVVLVVFVSFCFWQFAGLPFKFFGVLSPLVSLFCAGALVYPSQSGWYWSSVVVVSGTACLLLVAAKIRLRRALRAEMDAARIMATRAVGGREAKSWRLVEDRMSPVEWLVSRQRGIRATVWAAALVGVGYQAGLLPYYRWFGPGAFGSFYLMMQIPMLAVAVTGGALFAWAASRFFLESRRTGELELLLTTPLGAEAILAGQWSALKRLLRWPVAVMAGAILLRLAGPMLLSSPRASSWQALSMVAVVIGLVNTLLGLGALCWLGLWFGLRARGQASAIVWTVGLGKGVPLVISTVGSLFLSALYATRVFGAGSARGPSYLLVPWLPQIAVLLLFLWFIREAKRRLLQHLAGVEPGRFNLRQTISETRRDAAGAFGKLRRWTPS